MLKLVWVPKEFKNFSFKGLHEEMQETLEELKKQQRITNKTYADLLIYQNKLANFTEEEMQHNIRVIVKWMEKELGL